LALFLEESEADFGMGEGDEVEEVLDVSAFGLVAFEELSASGDVEEQLTHLDGGAWGMTGATNFSDGAALDDDLAAFFGGGLSFFGGELESADAGDTGEGFAAKPHGGDAEEVGRRLDFAGGMPFEAHECVVAAHAEAVVGDADQRSATALDLDSDSRGLGVDGIFDEFFDDAGGTFNNLTGGDLVGDSFREEADAIHASGRGRVKLKMAPWPGSERATMEPL